MRRDICFCCQKYTCIKLQYFHTKFVGWLTFFSKYFTLQYKKLMFWKSFLYTIFNETFSIKIILIWCKTACIIDLNFVYKMRNCKVTWNTPTSTCTHKNTLYNDTLLNCLANARSCINIFFIIISNMNIFRSNINILLRLLPVLNKIYDL